MKVKRSSPPDIVIAFLAAIISLVIISGCSSQDVSTGGDGNNQGKPDAGEVSKAFGQEKSDEGKGGVTAFASFEESGSDKLEFKIRLETHSIDLTDFDAKKNIYLVDKNGGQALSISMDIEGDSHHKEIMALFSNNNLNLDPGASLALVITGLAGEKQRKISWIVP